MPIRNPADAREVEDCFKSLFVAASRDRAREIRKLFVEVLDFEAATGQVSLAGAPATVTLPQLAERIAQLDGVHVLYLDLNTVDNDRVRKAEVEAAAKRIADQLGEDMLLVVINKSGTQLHIIHPDFGGARLVLRRMVIGHDVPRRTVVQQISNIYSDYGKSKNLRKVLREAFDVEPVTTDFFRKYKEVFEQALNAITGFGDSDDDKNAKRLFTQTLFNRLMFVHFLSRKGWLSINGDKDYLRALWDDYRARAVPSPTGKAPNFYRDRLRLLFFTGLNNPDSRDLSHGASPLIGSVPFLNGGLFTEGDFDVEDSPVGVPDSVIEQALKELFGKFNFTVMESTPFDIEVAVDPEMLGKVFEELVNERHDSGAYYTPRPVVAFMCRVALKGYLESKDTGVSVDAIAGYIENRDTGGISVDAARRIGAALDEITVVDPACGSGAFLLGMMQELVDLQTTLYNAGVDSKSLHALKLHIIERNLYGVDIDEFAVNIAMLRLWLSLAIDFDGATPPALPNLDFKIVRGDSLLGPDPSSGAYVQAGLGRDVQEVRRLADMKATYMRESNGKRKDSIKSEINELQNRIRERLGATARHGVIDWRVEFGEVFDENLGFDVAIANPPYVRQEDIGASKTELKGLYSDAAVARSDLYCYFYARALQLLAHGGSHVFVCSNSWLDVGYGAKLQEYLLKNAHVRDIFESAVERQFSTADINTIISVIRKGQPDESALTRFVSLRDEFDKAVSDASLRRELIRTRDALFSAGTEGTKYTGDKWGGKYLRAPDIYHHILDTKADRLVCLGDISTVRRGITTGANDFFYLTQDKIDEWGIEREFLRPLVFEPEDSPSLLVNTTTLPMRVFVCHDDIGSLAGTKALEYIKWGEKQQYHTRKSVSSRGRWYDLGRGFETVVAMGCRVNTTSRTLLAHGGLHFDKSFYRLQIRADAANRLCALMNSTLAQFMINLQGRTNLGGGLLEIEVYETKAVLLPNPDVLGEFDESLFLATDWDVLEPSAERRQIDDAVFDALSLTKGERDAVYEGVTELVENRLRRARSVRGRG